MKLINKRIQNEGFSLAEILLSLTIVGAIASFTIPHMVQNIQDQMLKTAWKETFSMLSQANKRVLMSNAGSIAGTCSNYDSNCFKNLYKPHMKILKNCPASAVGNCWSDFGTFYFRNGTPISNWSSVWSSATPAGLILNNGARVLFSFQSSDCSYVNVGVTFCGGIDVDVNGSQGPNMYAKDIFEVWQVKDRIVPLGAEGDYTCGTADVWGFGCSAMYLRQ